MGALPSHLQYMLLAEDRRHVLSNFDADLWANCPFFSSKSPKIKKKAKKEVKFS